MRFLEETCVKAGLERDAWKESGNGDPGIYGGGFSGIGFRSAESPEPVGSDEARLFELDVVAREDFPQAERDQDSRGIGPVRSTTPSPKTSRGTLLQSYFFGAHPNPYVGP